MTAYDEIVSLGSHCRVAYNLRRTFGIARAFPFDWWITPTDSLVAFLDDPSLDKLYDPGLMAPVMHGEKIFAIDNVHYGIQLQHEFPRWKNGSVVSDWAGHVAEARQRTEFLWNRLVSLAQSERILFVRWFSDTERRALKRQTAPAAAVREALTRRFPTSQFDLLLINPPVEVEAPGVRSLQIQDRGGGWRGSPQLWTETLLAQGITWTGTPSAETVDPQADHETYA